MAGRGESQRAEAGQEDDDGDNDGEDNDDVGADDDDDDDRLNQVGRAGGATVNACR